MAISLFFLAVFEQHCYSKNEKCVEACSLYQNRCAALAAAHSEVVAS